MQKVFVAVFAIIGVIATFQVIHQAINPQKPVIQKCTN